MNGLVAAGLVVLIAIVASAPRRWAALAMLAGVLYATQGQEFEVMGLSLFPTRFLEAACLLRVYAKKEFSSARVNKVDRMFLWVYVYAALVYVIRSDEGRVYAMGTMVDACFAYFSFRGLIRDLDDLSWILKAFTFLLLPYVGLVMVEALTSSNPFAFMGGFGGAVWERDGRPRCVGSFRHPSLLGTLGATFVPLYIGMLLGRTGRLPSALALSGCTALVWASNSGGPASSMACALFSWFCWPLRTRMARFRKIIACTLIVLAICMKAPIWFVLARISSITGGDGWHRSYLIGQAVTDLSRWWLAGMPIADTRGWFPYVLKATDAADITNQFVYFGVNAGLLAIVLFIILLTRAYGLVGAALARVREQAAKPAQAEFMLWALGATLTVHIFNWMGITYFDQSYMLWCFHLAALAGVSQQYLEASAPEPAPAVAGEPAQTDVAP